MTTRRKFLKGAAVAGPATLAAPSILHAQEPIRWRFQTYAGSALGEEVTKPAIDAINAAAQGELEIELFYADQIVPTGELFQALQRGTIDGVHSDDDSMASPTPVRSFGGYFPLATKHALDVPVLFNQYGLTEIWAEEYAKVGVKHISAGSWDPCHFATKDPINSLADLQGKRLRVSGLEQGRLLNKLGGSQVSMAGGEIYQSLERGVIDGAEFSTPNVDWSGGFQQVTGFWATPGWHQSASVFGVMINKASWDALSAETQEKLQIAADATMLWSLAFTERRANDAYKQFGEVNEITRMDDESLAKIQETANEVIEEVACENPTSAKVYLSQLEYLADYSSWRSASAPFNLGRNPDGPDLEKIRACAE